MAANLPHVEFSLREGYLPSWRAQRYIELGRPVNRAEVTVARPLNRWLGA